MKGYISGYYKTTDSGLYICGKEVFWSSKGLTSYNSEEKLMFRSLHEARQILASLKKTHPNYRWSITQVRLRELN